MSTEQALYTARRAKFIEQDPSLANRLPERWPADGVFVSGPDNEYPTPNQSAETLVIGFTGERGSWGHSCSAIPDVNSVSVMTHHITVIVLPEETLSFAARMGVHFLAPDILEQSNIAFCFPETPQDVVQILHKLYGTAGQAASIGGFTILDDGQLQ